MSLVSRCIAECFGTFCLVFAGTGAIVTNDLHGGVIGHVGVALTFGLVVMVMIYAIGKLSGAHINPAVTIGFWVARKFPGTKVLPFVGAQSIGAILASLVLSILFQEHITLGATIPSGDWHQAFMIEIFLTTMLMFVILRVSSNRGEEKGVVAGIAIGATVGLCAMFAGPISGASMNPARSMGPALATFQFGHLWIYFVSPILGACIAVGLDWSLKITSTE